MNDDLLREDGDDDVSPLSSYKYQDPPQSPEAEDNSKDVGPHRLVIAIDYGTTFTGAYAYYSNAFCSLLTVLSRCWFRCSKALRSEH